MGGSTNARLPLDRRIGYNRHNLTTEAQVLSNPGASVLSQSLGPAPSAGSESGGTVVQQQGHSAAVGAEGRPDSFSGRPGSGGVPGREMLLGCRFVIAAAGRAG